VIAFKAILEVHGKIVIENIYCSIVNSFICLQKFFLCLKINWHLYKTKRKFFTVSRPCDGFNIHPTTNGIDISYLDKAIKQKQFF